MQTTKARTTSSSEVTEKSSPRAASSKKTSPRQLKTSPRYTEPTASSSNLATRPPKERSPKVSDRKSPRSPLFQKKHARGVAKLESQISQLDNDLKNTEEQLCSSETSRKQPQQEAEDSNQQLLDLDLLEKQFLEQSVSEKANVVELSETSEERGLAFEVEVLQKQHLHDSAVLTSALDEIKQLKAQLEIIAESDTNDSELHKLKEKHEDMVLVVEEMKKQLNDCKKSEAQAQEVVGETLMQLQTAKKMVEALRSDGCKSTQAYDAMASQLENSRARVDFLEDLVTKLKAEINNSVSSKDSPQSKDESIEIAQLRSSLEVAEIRHNEEQARTIEQMKNALEMVEQIKSTSGQREAELEAELRKSRYEIEELKANMMDRENELQGMCDENDTLIISVQREHELEMEVQKLKTECENMYEENETLKLEIIRQAKKLNDEAMSEIEAARSAEREALMKTGYMAEEIDKSNKKAARVTEQLEAAQAAIAEMETELRKLKVQSDQWRKAAEVAASILSVGNNGHLVERTGSMDNNYSPRTRRITSPYEEDFDEDLMKKKNVNMLRRFGVLWKKPQK